MGHEEESAAESSQRRTRVQHTAQFKRRVVNEALCRPAHARVKPTARCYPGVQPVQIRNWIRQFLAERDAADSEDEQDDDGAESDGSEVLGLHKLHRVESLAL